MSYNIYIYIYIYIYIIFDILSWQKTNGLKFTILQAIARDVLAILRTIVACKSAFGTNGQILTSHHSRLHRITIKALMCTRCWIWNSKPSR